MRILGLMSGSSLDGLDMALVRFDYMPGKEGFQYELEKCQAVELPNELKERLSKATVMNSRELLQLDVDFGRFLGQSCSEFVTNVQSSFDYISSHGHTIFHYPENGFTLQIGKGSEISEIAKIPVICDFRSSDISLGGTGAPFAPIADKFLFPKTDVCVNLGGICNISVKKEGNIFALDTSPCNQLLNFLASKKGKSFDEGGKMASMGKTNSVLLEKLLSQNGFVDPGPRALDNSWVQDHFIPILNKQESVEDALFTVCQFIAIELKKAIEIYHLKQRFRIHFSGGGAFNSFLIKMILHQFKDYEIEIEPLEPKIIEFKEAILMALMGYLRILNLPNVIKTVTGASEDAVGGAIYIPAKSNS